MKTVKLVCPSCSAEMEVDEEKLLLYCPYCGKKLQMDFPHIDEVFKEKKKQKDPKRELSGFEWNTSTEKGRDSKSMSRPGKTKKLAGKC